LKIIFTNIYKDELFKPIPASSLLPDWYKKTNSYILDNKKQPIKVDMGKSTPATIKKCVPVFDAITSGYFIFSNADLFITQKNENGEIVPYYQWASNDLINFHPTSQAELHPLNNNFSYPKWMNSWAIKTPKGYSCLVITPQHRDLPFTILSGIVDTDTYDAPINFPFILNDSNFEGMIPAGTPIAQIIPFKRDSWKMSYGSEKELKESLKSKQKIIVKFFDAYRNMFWSRKDFK
jgi:hypothetical protein